MPISWLGGFAALDDRIRVTARVWISKDGHQWNSHGLPFAATQFGTQLLAYRNGLVLAQLHGDIRSTRFDVWMSNDGVHWTFRSRIGTSARTPGFVSGGDLVALGDRLAVVGYVGRDTCCGAPVAQPGQAGAKSELGSWAWISQDARTWKKTRVRGVGTDPMSVYGSSQGDFFGIRANGSTAWLIRSADGIHWTSLARVPHEVDLYGYYLLAATTDGYVLAADTDGEDASGHSVTTWRLSSDGSFQVVLQQMARQVSGLAAEGQTIVLLSEEFHSFDSRTGPQASISVDGGATFALSAGWPDLATTDCIRDVVIHDSVAVAGGGCEIHDGPSLFVADLSEP